MDGAGEAWPTSYVTKPPVQRYTYTFFLSSGADVVDQRDEFEELVKAMNAQYRTGRYNGRSLTFEVDRWEHDAPRRIDGPPNEEFVRRAIDAHCTVVLLSTVVRPGTRDEIEGVLGNPYGAQLAVVRMAPEADGKLNDTELQLFLDKNRNRFIYKETGPPRSRAATIAMVGIVARLVADVTADMPERKLFVETR